VASTHESRRVADYGTCAHCDRPSILKSRNICDMHYTRELRGIPRDAPVRGIYRDEWDRLKAAVEACHSAETMEEMDRADQRLRTAAEAYGLARLQGRAA
jgi:hypothetical protein